MGYIEFDIKHPVDVNLLLGLWSHIKWMKAQKYIHITKTDRPIWQGSIQWLKGIGRMCLFPSLNLASLEAGFSLKQVISLHGHPLQQ